MPGRLRQLLLAIFGLGIVFLLQVAVSSAQSDYVVTLSTPDISSFPHLAAFLDVHDSAGEFIHGLTPPQVNIQENGVQLPVTELQELKPGVQFVLAITPGSSFGIRDTTGTSRFDYLLQGMQAGAWVSQPSGTDDFSLVTVGGPQLTHASDPARLLLALSSFHLLDANITPNLEALTSALQLASDPTPRPGMERAVLYITSPQPSDVSLGLQSIIASANRQNIHIFVCLVASQDVLGLPETDLLRNLASQTHATFFAFSHDEPVPDLEAMLEPLRYVYQLGYDSKAATAGAQQLVAQVMVDNEPILSQPQIYELNIQAPSVVILDPPMQVAREFPARATPGLSSTSSDLRPLEQLIHIEVTFPDGYARPLAKTSLYVDGTIVSENTSPPFERLIWDLRPYTQDGTHSLKIEATDNLGWVGQSNEVSVMLTVPSKTQEVVSVVSHNRFLVIGLVVFASASILALVLILGGRIHPKPYPGQSRASMSFEERIRPAGYWERLRRLRDPLTQPVKIHSTYPPKSKPARKGWRLPLPWRRQAAVLMVARATLIPLVGSDEPTLPGPLQITHDTVILGSDPQKAGLVITDPSVEAVHARISQIGNSFQIIDAGTLAGTWVNYVQVPSSGINLVHADIIHLGRVGFRFTLSEPGTPPKVTITPLEPGQ
jgi:hypothetical protein